MGRVVPGDDLSLVNPRQARSFTNEPGWSHSLSGSSPLDKPDGSPYCQELVPIIPDGGDAGIIHSRVLSRKQTQAHVWCEMRLRGY